MASDDRKNEQKNESAPSAERPRKEYVAPRIEKRRSLQRVTLLTGMGQSTVSVISTMN